MVALLLFHTFLTLLFCAAFSTYLSTLPFSQLFLNLFLLPNNHLAHISGGMFILCIPDSKGKGENSEGQDTLMIEVVVVGRSERQLFQIERERARDRESEYNKVIFSQYRKEDGESQPESSSKVLSGGRRS